MSATSSQVESDQARLAEFGTMALRGPSRPLPVGGDLYPHRVAIEEIVDRSHREGQWSGVDHNRTVLALDVAVGELERGRSSGCALLAV
jgi:hypothetical protein